MWRMYQLLRQLRKYPYRERAEIGKKFTFQRRGIEKKEFVPSGRIYACSVFFDTDDNFASWENGQLKIRDSKDTEMRNIYQLNESCLDCPHHNFCLGGCGALRDLDKNFPGVVNSGNCDRKIVPICLLWTTYAGGSDRPPRSVQELR